MESQNVEWKQSWRDEYLKWICGFANAQGGRLEIGRSDKGVVVGLPNAKKLLEELPNKIRTTMGIVADVNLARENGLEYIVIDVMAHMNAISYRGRHYLRSGSTNQELTGFALDELIFRKYGRTWDSAPVLRVKASDFYNDAFDIFRKKAVTSDRLKPKDVEINNAAILNALKLTEGNYIYNNCQIPPDIEPKSILSGIRSIPHNPLLAGGFFRSGQIEAWGRGIEKMKNGCLADGLPLPEFDIQPSMFSITFKIRNNDGETNDTSVKGDVKGDVKTFKMKIIGLMFEDPHVSILQIANTLKTTKRRIERQVNMLKEEGNIERIGADKNGYWVVKNHPES